ncbi:O-antigen ligase family protein [Filimonas effusa]|uniref:O-antigen ligase domain-containing protein n=1 Tax=Filimonas effusa TaxID=2508721 RepID=A0A4Q1D3U2_9BACT|nr:O-antigen ligase family protein [Filimonas effusa]RXK81817.1 O-antigen ligase domain-containing protein [Filimonas effusa]
MELDKLNISLTGRKRRQPKLLTFAGDNRFLFVLALLWSVVTAYLVWKGGIKTAGLLAVLLVALPILYGIMAYPPFALVSLMVAAYFIMWVIRMSLVDFPLGTIMDSFEALILVTLFWHQRFRPDWSFMLQPVSFLVLGWFVFCLLLVANPDAASQLAWLYSFRTMAMAMLMYFAFVYFINSVKLIRLIVVTWLSLSVFAALYAMKQEYAGFAQFEINSISDPLNTILLYIDGHWRKFSIFGDPVAFSYNMVVSSIICVSLIPAVKTKWLKVLLGLIALLYLRVMLFSGTRGAYVLVPAALGFFFLLNFKTKLIPFAIMAVVVLIVMIRIPTTNPTLYRFQTAFRPTEDASFNVRTNNQQRIKPFILSHPFGGGLGAAGASGARFAPNSYLAGFPPDSGYVRLAVETGWLGLLIYCSMVLAALITGIINFFSIRNRELRAYCLGMLIAVFILNIGNYPQEAIIQFPTNILFYVAIALIVASKRIDKQEQNAVLKPVSAGNS